MRLLPLAALILALAGCGVSQPFASAPYSSLDLSQVRSTYTMILPLYVEFEAAYKAGDTAGILRLYGREQRQCKSVDVIDQRDSIDPNINLFQASATLDGMCNTIESAYAWWARAHHRKYNINVLPETAATLFVGMIPSVEKMPLELKYPDKLT